MISISQTAAKEIKRIQSSRQQPDSLLRLTVRSGGCSGLFYEFSLESNLEPENLESSDRANYFCESNGIEIILDRQTYNYIQNLQLDYSEDLMGGGFRFQNPQAVNTCGCGLSFAYKDKEKTD